MTRTAFASLAAFAALLALAVIMLGAYVRLSDAGLGCPDWPGCYGGLGAPAGADAIAEANAAYPERPVEASKAWKEMVHRYLASTLGLVIVLLAVAAWRYRNRRGLPVVLPTLLVGLVIFQGLLGMWTVTLLVKPAIVTAHLAGGLATLVLLWWLALRQGRLFSAPVSDALERLRPWTWGGLVLVCAQILLGGWTSTNYAAVACTEFPTCYGGLWWPPTDFREGFVLWRGLGVDYEYGVLDSAARTAIHLTHRIGALVVFLYLAVLAVETVRRAGNPTHRRLGLALGAALVLQVGLGIANVLGHLPLSLAVAHNGGAALLLLALVSLLHALGRPAAAPARVGDVSMGPNARFSS
ncbi:MAG: COX15/CtaA family protein [Pseudomonadota bacterium]|nr:COX15/CtaA family protein [Pseudomonadota bacterium]